MALILTDDQQTLAAEVEKLAVDAFGPAAFDQRFERRGIRDNMRLLADHGYIGLSMPEEVGGSGRPYLDTILAIEALARVCPATAESALMAMCGPAMFVARWGTPEQWEAFVRPVVRGERFCWISLTEEPAGTALTDLETSMEVQPDGTYLVNGRKRPSGVGEADDYYLVFARRGPGSAGIGAVLVERGTPGFVTSEPRSWMGDSGWCELTFDDVVVPADHVLDVPGISALLSSYSVERCAAGAFVLGLSDIAIRLTVDYVRDRQQFGHSLVDFQMVQAKLADMYLRKEQAQLLLYEAVKAYDVGDPRARTLSSAAKIATTTAACEIIDHAMQLHGLIGMSPDLSPLEWMYRLVRPYRVAGGTTDIHRSMIAGAMVGRRIDHRGESA